jgi:hypothetical protein
MNEGHPVGRIECPDLDWLQEDETRSPSRCDPEGGRTRGAAESRSFVFPHRLVLVVGRVLAHVPLVLVVGRAIVRGGLLSSKHGFRPVSPASGPSQGDARIGTFRWEIQTGCGRARDFAAA